MYIYMHTYMHKKKTARKSPFWWGYIQILIILTYFLFYSYTKSLYSFTGKSYLHL